MTSTTAEHGSRYPRSAVASLRFPRLGAIAAIVRRDYKVARSYRLVFFSDIFFTFLNLVVVYFVSRTFGDVAPRALGGAPSYFDFAAVGLTLSVVVTATTGALAQRVREEQLSGTLEAMVSQPVRSAEMSLGLAGFPILFATARTFAYLLLAGLVLGLTLDQADWIGVIVMLASTAAAFVSIGITAAAVVMVVKRGEALVALIIFGMTLVSGALFPIAVLPEGVKILSVLAPTRYAFDGFRGALFGGSNWGTDALVLATFSLVSIPIAIWLFETALTRSKTTGTVGQY